MKNKMRMLLQGVILLFKHNSRLTIVHIQFEAYTCINSIAKVVSTPKVSDLAILHKPLLLTLNVDHFYKDLIPQGKAIYQSITPHCLRLTVKYFHVIHQSTPLSAVNLNPAYVHPLMLSAFD